MKEAVITEKVVKGSKNHSLDGSIKNLLNIREARSLFYSLLPKL